MWTPQYDILVETLMGSIFEVTVTEKDTVGYIKSRIQKYEGGRTFFYLNFKLFIFRLNEKKICPPVFFLTFLDFF